MKQQSWLPMSWPPQWVNASCKGLWLAVSLSAFLMVPHPPVNAQTRVDRSTAQDSLERIRTAARLRRTVRVYGDVNWTMGISAEDFFADYRSLLGGTASGFDIPVGFAGGLSSFQLGAVNSQLGTA